ncbi:hypothetical protein [Parashewanella tropica]|uniref:hypothetical protein n=1 Tax=Parashewanella tropica TaxID=2547970 RepID=UPI0011E4DBAA|nr:hypothetical protein [Parashewanella tropica]
MYKIKNLELIRLLIKELYSIDNSIGCPDCICDLQIQFFIDNQNNPEQSMLIGEINRVGEIEDCVPVAEYEKHDVSCFIFKIWFQCTSIYDRNIPEYDVCPNSCWHAFHGSLYEIKNQARDFWNIH